MSVEKKVTLRPEVASLENLITRLNEAPIKLGMWFRCQLRCFQFVIGLRHVSGVEATIFIRGCKFHTSFRMHTLLNCRRGMHLSYFHFTCFCHVYFIVLFYMYVLFYMSYFFVFIVFVKLIQKLIFLLGSKTFFFCTWQKSRLKVDRKFKSLVLIESSFSERTPITVIYCRQSSTEVDYPYGLL